MSSQDRRHLLLTLADRVRPVHSALLIVDMQNDYVSPGGTTERRGSDISSAVAIVPRVRSLLDAARRVGAMVVHIQMTMDPDLRVMSDAEYVRRRVRWADEPITVDGTWGHEIISELQPQAGEQCVRKSRSSAFVGTNMDQLLRTNHIESVIVTGVVTNGCVNSTARGAMLHDYYVTVVRDAVASPQQDLHDAALLLLERQLGVEESIVDARRIVEEWAKLPAAAEAQLAAVSA